MDLDQIDKINIENLSVEDNNIIEGSLNFEDLNNMTVKELRNKYKIEFNVEPKSRLRKDDLINEIINKK